MIRMVSQGVGRFTEDPVGTLAHMRAATPPLRVGLMALAACTLCMVVIDLIYGPFAFPQSMQPGGKRAVPVFDVAAVELVRGLGVAATLWLCLRLLLNQRPTLAEAIWLTVPYALALVGFEIVQVSTWILLLATDLNLYGTMFMIGFGATILVLTASVRALAPDRDWLACLPTAAAAFYIGTFLPHLALIGVAVLMALDVLRTPR